MKKTCYSLLINNWKDESGFVDRLFDRFFDQQGQNLMITVFCMEFCRLRACGHLKQLSVCISHFYILWSPLHAQYILPCITKYKL